MQANRFRHPLQDLAKLRSGYQTDWLRTTMLYRVDFLLVRLVVALPLLVMQFYSLM